MSANHNFCRLVSIVSVSLFLVTSNIADAQLLEEIVVTAQKREQSLQDVGISVTAFSGDQIRELGYTNMIDISQQTPSLRVQQLHPSVTNLNIRGISQNDFASHLEAPVALYIDDAYVSSMGAVHGQTFDLERVEVLRGPQGTLFGRNATGGLLHFISARPTEEFEGYGEFGYGSYDQIKFEGAVSGPLMENVLGRLSAAVYDHDGYIENRIGEDLSASDSYSLRGQLQFNISDSLTLNLKASYSEDDTIAAAITHTPTAYNADFLGEHIPAGVTGATASIGAPGVFVTHPCAGCDAFGHVEPDNDPWTGSFDNVGPFKREIQNYHAELRWEINDGLRLVSISDYNDMDKLNTEDTDGTPFAQVTFVEVEDREQFSQEIRLEGEGERTSWLAGFYYLDFTTNSSGTVEQDVGPLLSFAPVFPSFVPGVSCFIFGGPGPCAPGELPVAVFFHDEKVKSDSWAIFGHVEYEFTESLSVTAALRYTEDDREMDILIDSIAVNGLLLNATAANTPALDQSFENVSAKFQLDWTPNDDWLYYVGFTRGHKAGNFTAPFFAPPTADSLPHDEEVLHSIEVGAKGELMDSRLRLNASAFYYDYKDYQASFFVNFTQVLANLDAEAWGAELEFIFAATEHLEFQFGASFLDSEVKDVGMLNGTFQNRELPNTPPFSFNGIARYTVPTKIGNVGLQLDFEVVDDFCFGVVCHPSEEEDGYGLLNAHVSYTTNDGHWTAKAFVRNLTEEKYRVFGVDSSFAGFSSSTFGTPRWWGVSIAYQWGE